VKRLLLLLASILLISSAYAAQYTICSAACDYTDVTSALEAVDGTADTVIITEAGTYTVTNITAFSIDDATDAGAIAINTSNVILDCADAGIMGASQGYGIYVTADDVAVTNCAADDYTRGIFVANSLRTQLDGISASSNSYDLALDDAHDTLVRASWFDDASTSAVLLNNALNTTIHNTFITASLLDVSSSGSGTFGTLVNVSFDDSKLSFSEDALLSVNWYFDAYVEDSDAVPVAGGTVNVSDAFATTVYSLTTDGSGYTTTENLTQYTENATDIIWHTNHTFYAYNGTSSDTRSMNISGTTTVTLTFDVTPPAMSIGSPTNDSYLSNDTTWVNLTLLTDETAVCRYNLSNSTFGFASGTLMISDGTNHWSNYSDLHNGSSYTVYYKCNDTSGNVDTNALVHTFHINETYDTVAPVITIVSPPNGTNLSNDTVTTNVSFTTDESAECRYNLSSAAFSFASGALLNGTGTSHWFSYSGLSAGSSYTVYYKCNDSNGNVQSSATLHTFSVSATLDITAPVISARVNTSTNQSVLITFTTDDSANLSIEYGTTVAMTSSQANASLATGHSISLTDLASGTTYYYNLTVCNVDSYCAEYGRYNFTTSTTADLAAPVISAVANTSVLNISATVSWTTNEASNTVVKYGIESGTYSLSSSSGTMATSHSRSLTSLSSNTTYYYVVNSTDASGNSAESGEYNFTTRDMSPPSISSVTAGSITASSASISWTTNENANSQVRYGTTSGSYTLSASDASYVSDHVVALSDLSDSSVYYYVVVSNDTAGNSRQSSQASFTTLDNTAPVITFTAPTNLSTLTDAANIRLTVTTNEAATCYADTYLIGASATSTDRVLTPADSTNLSHTAYFNATSASSGYNFYFTVVCTDADSNSASGTAYFALTDTTAPTATFVSPTPTDGGSIDDGDVTIELSVSEAQGTGYPKVSLDGASNVSMTASAGYYLYETTGLADGEHWYAVYVADASGNSRSYNRSVTVDSAAPEVDDKYPTDDQTIADCGDLILNITLSETGTCSFELFSDDESAVEDCQTRCSDREDSCVARADTTTEEDACADVADTCNDDCEADRYDSVQDGDLEPVVDSDDCESDCDDVQDDCEGACDDVKDTCMDAAEDNDDEDNCDEDYDDCVADCTDDRNDCSDDCDEFGGMLDYTFDSCLDDGIYLVNYTCEDDAGNEVTENTTFTLDDTTAPGIESVGPNGTVTSASTTLRVTTNEYATCRFSESNVAYASMNGTFTGASTGHTYALSGLADRAYTFYVLCNDSRGNLMTAPNIITFTVNRSASSSAGVSAHQSGIAAGASTPFVFSDPAIAISGIILEVNENVDAISIDVVRVTNTTNLAQPTGEVYQYLQITKEGLSNKQITKATIEFMVAKAWLTEHSLTTDSVGLFRYATGWEAVTTRKISEDSTNAYYEATVTDFSLFAIMERPAAPATTSTTATPVTDTNPPPVDAPADEKSVTSESPAPAKSGSLWLIILICVLVVGGGSAGLYVYMSHRHPQQDSFAGTHEQPTHAAADEASPSEADLAAAASPPLDLASPEEHAPQDELAGYIRSSLAAGMGIGEVCTALRSAGHTDADITDKLTAMGIIDPLRDYITSAQEAGMTLDEIKLALIDAGHGPQDVVNKFAELGLLTHDNEVGNYIEVCLNLGTPPAEIRSTLLSAGHDPHYIGKLFESFGITPEMAVPRETSGSGGTIAIIETPTEPAAIEEPLQPAAAIARPAETPDEVMQYIKKALDEKVPQKVITQALMKAGHTKKEVQKRFAEIEAVEKRYETDIKSLVKSMQKQGRGKADIKRELLASGIDEKTLKRVAKL
jgi:PGF-pre-PGF domain-containing protein